MKITDVVYSYSDTLVDSTSDFQYVVGVELGGGYDWDSLQAWYSPSRSKFYWIEGSGCSCNYLGQDVNTIDDLTAGNRQELTEAVRRKYDESYSTGPGFASRLLADLATVKTFRVSR